MPSAGLEAFYAFRAQPGFDTYRRCHRSAGRGLVRTECDNTGKPFALTMSEEIPPMVDQIRFFAGAARLLEGRAAAEYMAGHTSYVYGVNPWAYALR